MQYFISAIVIGLLVINVECHPICKQTADQLNATTNEPSCSTNLTANATFLNEWLSLHDDSEGIDQLRNRKSNTIADILLKQTTTTVII